MTRKIKVLVVDDERYAREELIYLLEQYPQLQIIGEAENGEKAIVQALQLQPDVVFLDIEMPRLNGMEVAKSLVELKKVPLIIFATAYSQFAADAFRINATDYLLKPYEENQLKETVHRIETTLYPTQQVEREPSLRKLAIEIDGEIDYLLVENIRYLCREENSTKIMTSTNEYEIKYSLKELESRLAPFSFFRIHKSYLVNLNYVRRLTPWFNGAYQLEVEGRDEKLSVSRNYAKSLRERLEL